MSASGVGGCSPSQCAVYLGLEKRSTKIKSKGEVSPSRALPAEQVPVKSNGLLRRLTILAPHSRQQLQSREIRRHANARGG